jgi:hypothetical protein
LESPVMVIPPLALRPVVEVKAVVGWAEVVVL